MFWPINISKYLLYRYLPQYKIFSKTPCIELSTSGVHGNGTTLPFLTITILSFPVPTINLFHKLSKTLFSFQTKSPSLHIHIFTWPDDGRRAVQNVVSLFSVSNLLPLLLQKRKANVMFYYFSMVLWFSLPCLYFHFHEALIPLPFPYYTMHTYNVTYPWSIF